MRARIDLAGTELTVDLSRPLSLAIELEFTAQPRHFGAPAAEVTPWSVPGFTGSVARGASCNCSILTLIPHCNGTHTESVGHLTIEPFDAYLVVPPDLVPAVLVTVEPSDARRSGESTDPTPAAGDVLVTQRALQERWPRSLPFEPRALIIRTLPNGADKKQRDYTDRTPPYLSGEAARWMVERGIEHVVLDLPSMDRAHDEGKLTAHRLFFGLPPSSHALQAAVRSRATITELAFIPDPIADGPYLLGIQTPAIGGDAVPSKPVLYALERIEARSNHP